MQQQPYSLKIKRENQYIMFSYNQFESDFSNPIVQESRGVILYDGSFNYACRPFDKFGNYGESYVKDIDWSTADCQEKVDGSLMKVWFADNTWHLSTNGSINAFTTPTGNISVANFGYLFELALEREGVDGFYDFAKTLDEDYCYMFELVSPINRVVVPYEDTRLYYLGCRNMVTLCEEGKVTPSRRDSPLRKFLKPKSYALKTLNDVLDAANNLPWDEEGYVCVDANFNRCKIKSPEYIKAHYARNNNIISKKYLIKIILENGVDDFLVFAKDYTDEINKILNEIVAIKHCAESISLKFSQKNISPKEYADDVNKELSIFRPFLFKKRLKPQLLWDEFTSAWDENKWNSILDVWETVKN